MANKKQISKIKLFDLLPISVYAIDNLGTIISCNKKAAELWGRTPSEKDKASDLWRSFPTFHLNGTQLLQTASAIHPGKDDGQKEKNFEFILQKDDGSSISINGTTAPILDGDDMIGQLVCFTSRELKKKSTGKSNGEDSMGELTVGRKDQNRRNEDRYHKMIEEVEDYAIVLLDENGIIQNWNKGAEKIKGYREEEIVGKSFSNFYFEEDRIKKLPESLLAQARENGKAIHEGWRKRKDGSRFWGSIVITALHDASNHIVGFSKVTRDLTERKAAEEKAREDNLLLEFQNQELHQFAYAASHDMKEPLRKINFYNNYVMEKAANELDEKSREYLQRSIHAVKRMGTLIDDLLAYSQTNSGNEFFVETDLNEILEEIVLSHKDVLEEHTAVFDIHHLPVLKVIPFQFRQLMDNLINNSIKYKHPDRPVNITVNYTYFTHKELMLTEMVAPYHRISVIDNGIGFEPKYADKIFEIFQRLSSQGNKGSGIGLAICKKIAQNHRGIIKASGKENVGARFDVYLPQR